jgi:ComF family protein
MDGISGCVLCNGRKIWFDQIFSPYIYCGTVSNVISIMKYGKNRPYAAILGKHLASTLSSEAVSGKIVIYPPMSFVDRFIRSFNQSEIIAEEVASTHCLEIRKGLIRKTKRTKPQASLTYDKRLKNLQGAFKISENVKGSSFLIVDDVCTTFSTINSIAELLKRNGAKEISAITFARTSPYFG